jgi:SSS family solute:Na+ symporter
MAAVLAVLAYMLIQFGIGVWVSRRIKTESDYLLAARNLGPVLLTFSIFATWFGAETVVGSSGRAYANGVTFGNAEPFGYGLCLVILGLVFAIPLWKRKLTTLADLYRERFSVGTERIAAVILIPSSIVWGAAQIRAFGYVLDTTAGGIGTELAIGIAAGFTVLYSMFGGLLVDAINDVLQGVMLAVGLSIVLIALLPHLGGVDEIGRQLTDPARVRLMPTGESGWAVLERWAIPVAGSVLATEIVGRVIAARSPQVARGSALMAAAMYIGIGLIPLVIGLVAPSVVPNIDNAEQILPHLARTVLPTVLYAVFAGALISAILSTVDSTLLVASGLLSHNLLVPIFGVTDEKRKVLLARGGVASFGVIAYFLARHAEGILDLVEQASALGSAGVLVTVVFGLFTNWGGARAAIMTLLAGLVVYVVAAFGGAETPFLLSLAASLTTYMVVAAVAKPHLSF